MSLARLFERKEGTQAPRKPRVNPSPPSFVKKLNRTEMEEHSVLIVMRCMSPAIDAKNYFGWK